MSVRTFTLGRYTCVERLGQSPVGELFRGKRFGLVGVERQLLIVKLHAQLVDDPAVVGRFTTALKTIAELLHPGILRLADHAAQGKECFAAYDFQGFADLRKLRPFLDGITDKERDAARGLLPAAALHVGAVVASALEHAAERKLIHGLLGPQSVWVNSRGQVLVSEIGLSSVLPATAWTGEAVQKTLSPYLAPEVRAGAPATAASDVYSLGALLGELLGDTATADEPKELRSLLGKARAAKPEARFSSMRDFGQALSALSVPGRTPEAIQAVLARFGQQFALIGDTVPQPVTISERSSAEPLPPPPSARGGLSGPVAVKPRGAANQSSKPGAKDKDSLSEAIAPPPKKPSAAPPRPSDAVPTARKEAEDTPLPNSRPLLVTEPKISVADPKSTAQPRAAAGGSEAGGGGKGARPSNDKIAQAQKARTGVDWLVAGGSSDNQGRPETTEDQPVVPPASATTLDPEPPSSGKKAANPVSINPRARFGTGQKPAQSASTPTQDLDKALISKELERAERAKTGSPAGQPGMPAEVVNSGDSIDLLSLGETSPALAPVRIFARRSGPQAQLPGTREPGRDIGSSPTNQHKQLEEEGEVTHAEQPAPAIQPYAPAPTTVPEPAPATDGAVMDPLASTGLNSPVSVPPTEGPRRTPLYAAVGAFALTVICGLVYLLVIGKPKPGGHVEGQLDAGTRTTTVPVEPATPPDTLIVSSTPEASAYVDGKPQGKTPLTTKLTPGPHKLLLVADQYQLLRKDVTAPSKLSLKLEPTRLPSDVVGEQVVSVKCKSEGRLRILVDGHDTGLTCPTEELLLSPGKRVFGFLNPLTDELQEKKGKVKKGKKPTKIKVKF